jgi:hypothetical protein
MRKINKNDNNSYLFSQKIPESTHRILMDMMKKYRFKIMTRNNIVIEKITIAGIDFESAQKKLNQMYRHCDVIEWFIEENTKQGSTDFDKIIDLIIKTE